LRFLLKKNVYLPIEVYMFKNIRILSAFVGLVALFFMSVASLATCSSDDPPEPGKSSSRQLYSSPTPAPPDPSIRVDALLDVDLRNLQENLFIDFTASISIADESYDSKFDKVKIILDYGGDRAEVLHEAASSGRGYSWESTISVKDDKYCGKTLRVCYEVYAKGNLANPVKTECFKKEDGTELVREESRCRPQSAPSIESSSSAVVSKTLSPVRFGGSETIRINQNTGVKFSTGNETGIGDADIYYSPNPANKIMAGGNVKIMKEFRDPECGCFDFTQISTGSCGSVPNPTNTSQFFEPCGQEETSIDPYMPNNYYLVKTNSETSWSSGWYIIVSNTTPAVAAGTTGIEIKAWKVD
jgi:hypothetical protein